MPKTNRVRPAVNGDPVRRDSGKSRKTERPATVPNLRVQSQMPEAAQELLKISQRKDWGRAAQMVMRKRAGRIVGGTEAQKVGLADLCMILAGNGWTWSKLQESM